eukprot:1601815-Pleurochrysis_carterae.AAC.4
MSRQMAPLSLLMFGCQIRVSNLICARSETDELQLSESNLLRCNGDCRSRACLRRQRLGAWRRTGRKAPVASWLAYIPPQL